MSALLTAAHLPLDGARDHLSGFLLAFTGERLVGVAGTERYGLLDDHWTDTRIMERLL